MKKKLLLIIIIFLTLLVCFVILLASEDIEPAEKLDSSSITVDFSAEGNPITHVASGFLHNPKDITWPPKETIAQVKPKHIRGREIYLGEGMKEYLDNYLKVETKTLLISSGPINQDYYPGDNGDWGPYKEMITKIVTTAQDKGYDFDYEIWNEPNGIKEYWPKSDKEFFETWKYTYQLIEKLEPNAEIVGPSITGFEAMCDYDADGDGKIGRYIDEFLAYAKANDVVPDILSWHELNLDPEIYNIVPNTEGGAASIVPHVAYARKLISDMNLSIKKIYINEYSAEYNPKIGLNLNERFNGAFAVQYFSALEEAEVDGALRGCWKDFDLLHRGNSCFDRMDNLITYDGKGRSNWYAYKYYAEMEGNIVKVVTKKGIHGIATINETNATLLMGTTNPVEQITITLKDLPAELNTSPKVTIEEVKYSGMEPGISNAINKQYSMNNGTLSINLTNVGEGNIYLIKVE